MKKTIGFFLMLFMFSYAAEAKVVLSPLIADGMVLQRESEVKIWGKADPSQKIRIVPSWDGHKYTVRSDSAGNWCARISTAEAGGPYSIRISDGEEMELQDIMLGDVWVCSGQSNMEHPVAGYSNQPVENSLDYILESGEYPGIRVFTVEKIAAVTPQEEVKGKWEKPAVGTTPHFSATAWFFARTLNRTLGIPIGIIHTSWGGATIETWLDRETLQKYPHFNPASIDMAAKKPQYRQTMLYNSMLYPLRHLCVKGFTWFQGESNVHGYKVYRSLFEDLVKKWRGLFQHAEKAPFYFVQLSPYGSGQKDRTAFLREAQTACLSIPYTGMAVTMDIGNRMIVHLAKKETVGRRLAYQALAKTYGMDIPCDGPTFKKAEIEGNKMLLTFDHADGGLCPLYTPLEGFEIAGEDGKFYPATARVRFEDQLTVWAAEVKQPKYVRYGFRNFIEGTLYNAFHLPAVPFRTDHFDPVK